MKEYILWGFDKRLLDYVMNEGLSARFQPTYNEKGEFLYIICRLSNKESRIMKKWCKDVNKKTKTYKLSLFKMEEFEAYA